MAGETPALPDSKARRKATVRQPRRHARVVAMLAKSILVFTAMLISSASQPGNDRSTERQRFFLTCIGTMRAAGAPAMPITANGLVDIAGKRVAGFGVGSAPILLLTDPL